ncbi:MAG: M14 family zinc carboxypeptidase, partial [Polyangiaceae bacterium]
MGTLPSPWQDYPDVAGLDDAWTALASAGCARVSLAGTSVDGRPIRSYTMGAPDGEPVLLTGLMHGVEVVGALALLDLARGLVAEPSSELLRHARIVVVPVVNPDAFHANCVRMASGLRAYQRCNARGVDINRNF